MVRQNNGDSYSTPDLEDWYIVKVVGLSDDMILLDHQGWYPSSSVLHCGETVKLQNPTMIGGEVLSITYFGADQTNAETEHGSIGPVQINEENFPDAVFREYVSKNFDTDGNGTLDVNEQKNVSEIDVDAAGLYEETDDGWQQLNERADKAKIRSLKGIEFFTELKELNCFDNELTELDVSQNIKLIRLNCGDNKLTSLNLDQNEKLIFLACHRNHLTELDVSHNLALNNLMVNDNALQALDLSRNQLLRYLDCSENQLTTLDLSYNPKLERLDCESNELTELDLSQNPLLTEIRCFWNQVKRLDISNIPNLFRVKVDSNTKITGDLTRFELMEEDDIFEYVLPMNIE